MVEIVQPDTNIRNNRHVDYRPLPKFIPIVSPARMMNPK
jgi:hypothetical protein